MRFEKPGGAGDGKNRPPLTKGKGPTASSTLELLVPLPSVSVLHSGPRCAVVSTQLASRCSKCHINRR